MRSMVRGILLFSCFFIFAQDIKFEPYTERLAGSDLSIKMIPIVGGTFEMGSPKREKGRKEPTTGEINYLNVFKHIHKKGFKGIMGMEHGNSKPGKAGEMAVIDAYRTVDSF